MSKMSDMAQTIEELRSAAAAITDAANWLSQQFSNDAEEALITEAQPEKKPELTLEQVRAVLADKSCAGHTAAVRELLQKYGSTKLSQVDTNVRDGKSLDSKASAESNFATDEDDDFLD